MIFITLRIKSYLMEKARPAAHLPVTWLPLMNVGRGVDVGMPGWLEDGAWFGVAQVR